MPRVRSSAIDRVEYDPATRRLSVTFRGGGTYAYYGVPPEVYEAFLRARSKGRFHAEHVRGRYTIS